LTTQIPTTVALSSKLVTTTTAIPTTTTLPTKGNTHSVTTRPPVTTDSDGDYDGDYSTGNN
jgi:hypothetical protein